MKYGIRFTNSYKKAYKRCYKRGFNMELLDNIVNKLAEGIELPLANHDHALSGNWEGYRECHIKPDWLLIYRIDDDLLILSLTDTGSHADLFKS